MQDIAKLSINERRKFLIEFVNEIRKVAKRKAHLRVGHHEVVEEKKQMGKQTEPEVKLIPRAFPQRLYPQPVQSMLQPTPQTIRPQPTILPPSLYKPAPTSEFIPSLLTTQKKESSVERKINLFLDDKSISVIECSGPEKNLEITRNGEKQQTQISLSEEEIKEVIKKFSNEAKIPLVGDIFRAVVKDLRINAILSDIIGSRFIITRISESAPEAKTAEEEKEFMPLPTLPSYQEAEKKAGKAEKQIKETEEQIGGERIEEGEESKEEENEEEIPVPS